MRNLGRHRLIARLHFYQHLIRLQDCVIYYLPLVSAGENKCMGLGLLDFLDYFCAVLFSVYLLAGILQFFLILIHTATHHSFYLDRKFLVVLDKGRCFICHLRLSLTILDKLAIFIELFL